MSEWLDEVIIVRYDREHGCVVWDAGVNIDEWAVPTMLQQAADHAYSDLPGPMAQAEIQAAE